MTVETRWTIEFDPEQIERLEGESFRRILARPSGREDWSAALDDARALVRPAARGSAAARWPPWSAGPRS